MLQELMNLLIEMYMERAYSNTIYCGYGTTIDSHLEYMNDSGSLYTFRTLARMDALAYKKARDLHDSVTN